jgi:hypothetical protein
VATNTRQKKKKWSEMFNMGETCNRCKERNNFAKKCSKTSVYSIKSENEHEEISMVNAVREKVVFAKMHINNKYVKFRSTVVPKMSNFLRAPRHSWCGMARRSNPWDIVPYRWLTQRMTESIK